MSRKVSDIRITLLGSKLKQLRQHHKLPVRKLAELLGVSYSYLSEIESGKKYPSLELLIALAEFYSVSLDDLLLDCNEINVN